MSRRPNPYRCVFLDDGKRCRRMGSGNPPLCPEHTAQPDDPIVRVMEAFLGHPAVSVRLDGVETWVKGKVSFFDAFLANSIPDFVAKGPRPGEGTPRTPPPRRSPPPAEDPRLVLHFGPKEPLTVQKVKDRKKMLAQMVHPDRGGDPLAMAKINTAAEALLKTLK